MESTIQQSFSLNLKVLSFLRLYSPEKASKSLVLQGYLVYVLFAIGVPSLNLLNFLFAENLDILQACFNATFLVETMAVSAKMLPFIRHRERIRKCLRYFESDFFLTPRNEEKKIMDECVRICRRNSMAFFSGASVALLFWNIRPLFLTGYGLPSDVWLPFDPAGSPMAYYCAYLFVALGGSYDSLGSTTIDSLIGGLAWHAACQFKVLGQNLQYLDEHAQEQISIGNNKNHPDKSKIIYGNIKRCIDYHNALLRFVKKFEDTFSLVVFSQFASSGLAICFCCLTLSMVEPTSFNALLSMALIMVISSQIYFYCYYGTMIIEESNSLTNAIYMSNWYEFDVKSRKALVTIMERSQRRTVVTAGKLLELSLDTFAMILRKSYSLLAVLKNYY